jgi:adenylate cyclase
MNDHPVKRRLAAILAADVVGYTKLMERDSDGTVAAWQTARSTMIDPSIEEHSGRIVKHTGDGFLAEFQTVQDAVSCAIAMQGDLTGSSLDFRMGVDLGDIIDDGKDIHGEGVNIAARLEALAEPGSIYISGSVHEKVRNRINADFEDMGDHTVKHIAAPVRVFRLLGQATAPQEAGGAKPSQTTTVVKPSIAVLPFDNMSTDPEQEFFVDGLTEDILTELSRFHNLFVISRHSTFAYKGTAMKATEVARDLSVRYVVEGSVRKSGDRIRVTVQLIDGTEDRHVWAERYDRRLEDIFDLQDEITAAITAILPGRVEADSTDRARNKQTENMAAYECVLAGKVLHHRSTREDNIEALGLLDRAIKLDPNYVHARAWRACVIGQAWSWGWSEDLEADIVEVGNELERALALDDNDADVHRIYAAVQLTRLNFDKALMHQEKSLALNPNYDLSTVQQGELMTWMGRPEEGVEWILKAMELNPLHPPRFWSHLGRAYFVARQYENSIAAFKHMGTLGDMQHAYLAACYAYLEAADRAEAEKADVLNLNPEFSVEKHLLVQFYQHEADRDHHREGLLKAGLPA